MTEWKWGWLIIVVMMANKIFKTESYSESVKKYETILLPLGKKSKGNFGDRAKFFEADDDIRGDYNESTFKDKMRKYRRWDYF